MTPARAQRASGLYSDAVLNAIDWALKPHEDERPQNTGEFLARLGATERTVPRTVPLAQLPQLLNPPTQTATVGMTSMPDADRFDADLLKRIETEAARVLGPIAPVIVRKAARKAATLPELCNAVAADIEDEKSRAAFLRKFANDGRTSPPTTHSPTQPRSMIPPSVSAKFSPDVLQCAEHELARHIGAIAGVVVRHAAAKARDEAELYLLVADEIQDPVEKKTFVRKAVMASRMR
jgi:hypothetical protein